MIVMENLVVTKAQELSDIELAILLCLVANQHCIIETEKDTLDSLQDELRMVCYYSLMLQQSDD